MKPATRSSQMSGSCPVFSSSDIVSALLDALAPFPRARGPLGAAFPRRSSRCAPCAPQSRRRRARAERGPGPADLLQDQLLGLPQPLRPQRAGLLGPDELVERLGAGPRFEPELAHQ